MIHSENSILVGLSVLTIAKIANSAYRLKREARRDPDGGVAGVLILDSGCVVQRTEPSFTSTAGAMEYMDHLVDACVEWHHTHEPACVEDAGFAC